MSESPVRTTMNGKPVEWLDTKTILNMKSGFQPKLLCDGPTFTAGTSCVYRCSFCYVPSTMARSPGVAEVAQKHNGFENVVIRRTEAPAKLRESLLHPNGKPKYLSPDDRRVIYASPLVDVAGNLDLCRETVEMCGHILELTNWHIRLLSKSSFLPWIAKHLENVGTFGNQTIRERMIFGVSTGTLNEQIAAAFEEGTARVDKRIESIRCLQRDGWRTFGMVCPSLPMPRQELNEFALRCREELNYGEMEHVWAEVINVRGDSLTNTARLLRHVNANETADLLMKVSGSKTAWEDYARETYEAHVLAMTCEHDNDFDGDCVRHPAGCPNWHLPKLRYLQYVNKSTEAFWTGKPGVVIL